jgi:hypothetical protein
MSSSLETFDMKSSSESMAALDPVVTGVGGAMSGPAEARILLLGAVEVEDIVASAAFRLRVIGGMVPAYACLPGTVSQRYQTGRGELQDRGHKGK